MTATEQQEPSWSYKRRAGDLAPNPELWAALDDGKLLAAILDSFYEEVFQDGQLSHFFQAVTKGWAAGKQHAFLMSIITGKKVYFGDRPRNAHHWMVISNELFDYRERMFEKHVRAHGVAEDHAQALLAINEVFRKQIVKDKPVPKKVRGVALPLDGYESLKLDCGTVCDGCSSEIASGTNIKYHVRTGRTYCAVCAPQEQTTA